MGRLFLRKMINISARAKHIDHWVHLNAEFRADVGWWRAFLPVCNNRCLILVVDKEALPDFTVYSDVSGSGAIWGNRWLQWEWEGTWADHQIAIKELIPIVVTCAVWDHQWQNKQVLVMSDNMAVVEVISALSSRDSTIMHLLRTMFST